jgi:hypothetical protein
MDTNAVDWFADGAVAAAVDAFAPLAIPVEDGVCAGLVRCVVEGLVSSSQTNMAMCSSTV